MAVEFRIISEERSATIADVVHLLDILTARAVRERADVAVMLLQSWERCPHLRSLREGGSLAGLVQGDEVLLGRSDVSAIRKRKYPVSEGNLLKSGMHRVDHSARTLGVQEGGTGAQRVEEELISRKAEVLFEIASERGSWRGKAGSCHELTGACAGRQALSLAYIEMSSLLNSAG